MEVEGISVWMETHYRQSVAGSAISRHHSFVRCAGQHRCLAPRSLCILFYVSDRQGSFTTIVPWRNLPAPFQPVPCSTLCVFLVCIHTLPLTALRTTHVGCPHWLTAF
jgi:hypothetical protein